MEPSLILKYKFNPEASYLLLLQMFWWTAEIHHEDYTLHKTQQSQRYLCCWFKNNLHLHVGRKDIKNSTSVWRISG